MNPKIGWQPWFAWFPVRTSVFGRWVWLQTIERRWAFIQGYDPYTALKDHWEYRLLYKAKK